MLPARYTIFVLGVLAAVLAAHGEDAGTLSFQCGRDVDPTRCARLSQLLSTARVRGAHVHMVLGEDEASRAIVPDALLASAAPGTFVVRAAVTSSAQVGAALPRLVVAVRGTRDADMPDTVPTTVAVLHGAFAALERMGVFFLKPLQPVVPAMLTLPGAPASGVGADAVAAAAARALADAQAPHWQFRGWHYHSEHPLELTEVLNGADAQLAGGGAVAWEDMVGEVEAYLEWCVANRVNRLQWILLQGARWRTPAQVQERQARLRRITSLAHSFGVAVGADVPIAEQQQRAWYMTDGQGSQAEMAGAVAERLRWLRQAGFDYLATESGFTEFTHPDDRLMLWLLNATTAAAAAEGMPAFVKCHCSTGQTCPHYLDPRTGQPVNFNFLPMFADARLGVMPHTVQTYAFDDPAPTYGNTNFSYMLDFAVHQARSGRPVVYHGETGYWVNFDIDVPLLLPLYADRRLYDLRLLAAAEAAEGVRLQGQVNFHSGFEWGNWVADVVTARGAWDPIMGEKTHAAALMRALDPIAQALPLPLGGQLAAALAALAAQEHELLVLGHAPAAGADSGCRRHPDTGRAECRPGADVACRNGHAYLAGVDTWTDLMMLGGHLLGVTPTQPARVALRDLILAPRASSASASATAATTTTAAAAAAAAGSKGCAAAALPGVLPLLDEMARAFADAALHLRALAAAAAAAAPPAAPQPPSVPAACSRLVSAAALVAELAGAGNVTALRAAQVAHTFRAALAYARRDGAAYRPALKAAADTVLVAAEAVAAQEAAYSVTWRRVGGWHASPTVYNFGYLWTVHSLLYWWRDVGVVAAGSPQALSPCYLNYIDGVRDMLSRDALAAAASAVGHVLDLLPFGSALGRCLHEPDRELVFPRDLGDVGW